ncbi:TrbG/VirB9 family P-type conjugative transfer protein [Bordetella sp. 2513F-2]
MLRFICISLVLPLAGCALSHGRPAWGGGATAGVFDFNWQLSGDAAVAPLQVFGTDREIWLQFDAGQPIPALFASTPQGDRPLSYRRQEPYVIVEGNWPRLTLRGGRYAAQVTRAGVSPGSAPAGPTAPSAPLPQSGHARLVPEAALAAGPALAPVAASPAGSAPDSASPIYRAAPPDTTLRAVLSRWAGAAGWTFQAQHWSVDVDIPLAGSADFPGEFRDAVRALLSSTELTDRPVQPCFYANRVLRVVPHTQACDRTMARTGASS